MRRWKRSDPCWIFTETDKHAPWKREYRFDFSYIRSTKLRGELQDYMWYHYRKKDKTFATLRQEHSWFKYYEEWLFERQKDSLFQICRVDAEGFLTYLRTCISPKTGQSLRLITQKHILNTVRGIYRWYSMQQPECAAFVQLFPKDVHQRIHRVTDESGVSQDAVARFLNILEHAHNPCLRCGGTILAMTGLSPADLLGLQTDCIEMGEKGARLRYYHHRRGRVRTIPVSNACVQAVQELQKQTDELRMGAPEEHRHQLFLYRNKWEQIVTPSPDLFRYWMRCAQTEHKRQNETVRQHADIGKSANAGQEMDAPAELPDTAMLTATMVRNALFSDMRERNVPYMIVQELSGHYLLTERGDLA